VRHLSARIALKWGQVDRATAIVSKIYSHATPEQIALKVKVLNAAVKQSIEITRTTTFWQRLHSILFVPVNRRALIVACGMQAFQQLCGFNTLMYYSATLFKQIGFDQPTAVGLIVSGTNFLFTLFALKYIDIIGRRTIMLFSAPGMVVGLTLASVAFHCAFPSIGVPLGLGADREHAQTSQSRRMVCSSTARTTHTHGPALFSSP
jgi:SP family myo-inositol transporter-like MFS transporter 13